MPIGLVNPATQPQGAPGVPISPIAGALDGLVAAYGKRFPTPAEQAEINQRNAEAAQIQQRMGSGSELANTVSGILARQQPTTVTAQDAPPAPDFVGPMSSRTTTKPGMNTGDAMRSGLADLVRGAADSGDPAKATQLAMLVSSYLPDTPKDIATQTPGTPTTQDMAMMAGGHPYAATPGGVLQERTLGTPEMRNRNFKIQQIVAQHSTPGMTAEQTARLTQQASDIVDGVVEGGLDPNTRQPYVLNKLDLMNQGGSGAPAPAAPATATVGTQPMNNPGNLRPPGQTTGFMQYPTPEAGAQALQADLLAKLSGQSKAMGGQAPTLRNIISTYSPPNENNTAALIVNASKRMGVDPDAPLGPQHLQMLTDAILQQEQGGTSAHAAPAAVGPLKAGDNGFAGDTSEGYGGSGTINMLKSMISAVPDETGTNTGQLATDKISLFKKALLDLDQIRSGGKQSDMSRGLIANTLPTTGPIEDIGDVAKRATTGAGTAKAEANSGLDTVLNLRDQDQRIVEDYKSGKGTVSLADFQKAEASIIQEDSIIQRFGSPDLQKQYGVRYGGAQAPKTNLQKGTEATTPAAAAGNPGWKATPSNVSALPVGAIFIDNSGKKVEKLAGGKFRLVGE